MAKVNYFKKAMDPESFSFILWKCSACREKAFYWIKSYYEDEDVGYERHTEFCVCLDDKCWEYMKLKLC